MADRRRPQIIYMTCKKINTVSWNISGKMFTVWTLCLITVAFSQDMETTTSASPNVTILFPTNKTLIRNLTNSKSLQNTNSQTWKLEAILSESNLTDKEAYNRSKSNKEKKKEEDLNKFKPSVHLGSFFDEDDAEFIDTPIAAPVYKKPSRGFVSSVKDKYQPTFNQIEKEIQQTHNDLPYNFEDAIFSNDKPNCCDESIDSKPTVEAPTKIPAGGLYKSPDAFKENHKKKSQETSDEKFDLDIVDDGKEVAVKKRVNPWKNLLRLVTAFIPVGLIISALTPSVITIHNVDNKRNRAGVVRRSDSAMRNLSPISEQCRRRLLCEIHSDRYYVSEPSKSYRSKKHCYKLHCEDTEALWKMLRWLFTYNNPEEDQNQKHLT